MRRSSSWFRLLCNCSGIPRKTPGDGCVRLPRVRIHRPDLAIYSQTEEATFGRDPTWNNPDIVTNDWGPFHLMEAVEARIANRSARANATNAVINCLVGPFGIGMPQSLYASHKTTVVAGNAVTIRFPLDATLHGTESQRLSFTIQAEHPFDTEPINNRGSQCIDGRQTSTSGRRFAIDVPVRNPLAAGRRIDLRLIPGELNAAIDWTQHDFAPGEEKVVRVDITVPAELHGTDDAPNKQPVSLVATWDGGRLLGGVTVIARIDT